jgi:hypothetical protein
MTSVPPGPDSASAPAASASASTSAPSPSGPEWLAAFAAAIGGEAPDAATIEVLLDLAGVAAHSSERIAAPIACYIAGRMGIDPAEALATARSVSASISGSD